MEDDTMLILGGALAIGAAVFFLKKPVEDLTEPTGEILGSANDYLRLPLETAGAISDTFTNTTNYLYQNAKDTANKSSMDKIIAEGERVQTTLNIGQSAVLQSASRYAAMPTKANSSNLQATVAVNNLRETGVLTPGLINLGSIPVKQITTPQLSIYKKVDAAIGGILPGGVKLQLPSFFKVKSV